MEKRKLKVETLKQKPILILQVLESLQPFWILLVILVVSIGSFIVDFCTYFVNGRVVFPPPFPP